MYVDSSNNKTVHAVFLARPFIIDGCILSCSMTVVYCFVR